MTSFFCIHPPPELLPVLGPLERYMTPTFDTALIDGAVLHLSCVIRYVKSSTAG